MYPSSLKQNLEKCHLDPQSLPVEGKRMALAPPVRTASYHGFSPLPLRNRSSRYIRLISLSKSWNGFPDPIASYPLEGAAGYGSGMLIRRSKSVR